MVVALLIWSSKRNKNGENRPLVDIFLARLKIVIGFYQVTAGTVQAFVYVKWPEGLAKIGEYAEVIQLNVLKITPISCVMPSVKLDAFGNMITLLSLNIVAAVMAFCFYTIRWIQLKRHWFPSNKERRQKLSETKIIIYRNLFLFYFITFPSTCSSITQVLPPACHKICSDEDEHLCSSYLKADYSVSCESPSYKKLINAAYASLVYPAFVPLAAFVYLWKHHKKGNLTNNQKSRKTENIAALEGMKFIFENYSEDAWYWELVEMTRKIVLTSGVVLIGRESRAYVGLASLISGLYAALFAFRKPVKDVFENRLQLASLLVTFANLAMGAILKIPKETVPSDVDPYVDTLLVNILVVAANCLVIGIVVGEWIQNTLVIFN